MCLGVSFVLSAILPVHSSKKPAKLFNTTAAVACLQLVTPSLFGLQLATLR